LKRTLRDRPTQKNDLDLSHSDDGSIVIRLEHDEDYAAIDAVNVSAFETHLEADLVNALRENISPIISLVAIVDEEIVGHIVFSPAELPEHPECKVMALGPMAVAVQRQNIGIGSALVRRGIDECKLAGYAAVVVLGHPSFYPRFGFLRASSFEISSEYNVADEVFMALELKPNSLKGMPGKVRYSTPFASI